MTAPTQADKAHRFRALHARGRAFIIPNPWDIGTARLLAHLRFEALATTSAGFAFSMGQRDNTITPTTSINESLNDQPRTAIS